MKKTFLRILPVVAAVLLATSCSKDDNGDVNSVDTPQATEDPNPTPEQPAEQAKTVKIPFSVKVDGGETLSKITYVPQKNGDNVIWNKVSRTFNSETDVEGKSGAITLTVNGASEGSGITQSTLKLRLKEGKTDEFEFYGDIEVASEKVSEFNSEPGIALVGEFTVEGTALPTSSDVSLDKLMTSCTHTYKTKDGEFTSKSSSVMLYDQNVYLAVQMSPLQHILDVKIDGKALSECNLSNDGQVWIALEGGKSVSTNFLSKTAENVVAGHIYTIDRSGLVDLGINGILWADKNIGAEHVYDSGDYYTFDQANGIGDDVTSPVTYPLEVPTGGDEGDFYNLYNSCTWVWTEIYNGSVSGYIVFKSGFTEPNISKHPHIFLPLTSLTRDGLYWSSTVYNSSYCYRLVFYKDNVSPKNASDRNGEHTVRAVRRINSYNIDEGQSGFED